MSLKAWYPFDNSTNDIAGTNNLTFTLPGTYIDGKVFKAFDSSGATSGSAFMAPLSSGVNFNTNIWSVCIWVKPNFGRWTTVADRYSAIDIGSYYIPGETDIFLSNHSISTAARSILCGVYSNQVGKTSPGGHTFTDLELNDWIFLALVSDGTNLTYSAFANQSKIWRKTLAPITWDTTLYPIRNNLHIGGYGWTTYNWRGGIDDTQVYDHAISEKEMREIAKAKILHYTFNDFQEPTTNMVPSPYPYNLYVYASGPVDTTTGNETGLPTLVKRYTVTQAVNIARAAIYPSIVVGASYTFSFKWKYNGITTTTPSFTVSAAKGYPEGGGGNTLSLETGSDVLLSNGWHKYTYTFSCSASPTLATTLTFGLNTSTTPGYVGETFDIYEAQLEQKSYSTPYVLGSRTGKILDISGYQNNSLPLVESTTPSWVQGKLGTGSYNFAGLNKHFTVNNKLFSTTSPSQEFTLSAWINPVDTAQEHWIIDQYNYSTYRLIWGRNITNGLMRYFYNGSSYYSTSAVPVGVWSHVSLTRSAAGSVRFYLNGVLDGTATSTGIFADINTHIGNYYSTYTTNYKLDDVRVYATALSDVDILELYNTRAQLDINGNLFLNEINTNGVIADTGNLIKYQYWIPGTYNFSKTWDQNVTNRYTQTHRYVNYSNIVEVATNPVGEQDVMYKFNVDSSNFIINSQSTSYYNIPYIDPTKTYRYSQWIFLHNEPSPTNNQPNYLGILGNTVCNINTTTLNSNPYFTAPTNTETNYANKWVLQTFMIYPYGSTGNATAGTLYYLDGTTVNVGSNYNWANAITTTYIRQYHMYQYNIIQPGSYAKIYRPRMDIVDGSEPTIRELLLCSKHRALVDASLNSTWNLKNVSESGQGNFDTMSEVGVTDGLVGWWKLNGDAKDYSGNNNHGTVIEATISPGLKNLAYKFDGTNDTIAITTNSGDTLDLQTQLTLNVWFNATDFSSFRYLIAKNVNSGYGDHQYGMLLSNGTAIEFLTMALTQTHTYTFSLNTWYMATCTWNGLEKRIFINGVELGGPQSYTTPLSFKPNFRISGRFDGTNSIFCQTGKITDTRIYNRALSVSEINTLYKQGLLLTGMQISSDGALYLNGEIKEGL